MPLIVTRLEYDDTGTAPANRVTGEQHTLGDGPFKIIVPNNGAFYTESVTIIDQLGRALVRGTDYWVEDLVVNDSALNSKEIARLVIIDTRVIANQNVTEALVSYQALGGHGQTAYPAIEQMVNTLLLDTRPVDWTTGVLNKDIQYPPSWHPTPFRTTYGYEAVIYALERLGSTLQLSGTPLFEATVAWVESRLSRLTPASYADIDSPAGSNHLITVDTLRYALQTNAYPKTFRFILNDVVYDAATSTHRATLTVDMTGVEDGAVFGWSLTPSTGVIVFDKPTASVVDGQIQFYLSIANKSIAKVPEFTVLLRRKSSHGMVVSRSPSYTVSQYFAYRHISLQRARRVVKSSDPRYTRTARAKKFIRW